MQSDPAASQLSLTPEQLQRAILARLQFEQAMGIETVRRRELERPANLPTTAGEQGQARTPPAPPFQGGERATTGPSAAVSAAAPQDVAARWKDLEARALACIKCPLHQTRTNVVFGVGNRSAKLVFVGEAPGEDEDKQGESFVVRAGQLLNKIITAMKWTREEVYICNTIKCRPPENRPPLPDELFACNPLLVEQLELIVPKVIVALGSPAAKTLLQTNQGIMSLRGHWGVYRGIPVMPTFHPAYLLRSYTEENRRSVWQDMKMVVDKLNE
jgi:uracil-DNA glycosylase family 4